MLSYNRFVTAEQIVHAVERYESSVAALEHLRIFRDEFAERFSSMVTRRRFTVYGLPSAELKAALDGFARCISTVLVIFHTGRDHPSRHLPNCASQAAGASAGSAATAGSITSSGTANF